VVVVLTLLLITAFFLILILLNGQGVNRKKYFGIDLFFAKLSCFLLISVIGYQFGLSINIITISFFIFLLTIPLNLLLNQDIKNNLIPSFKQLFKLFNLVELVLIIFPFFLISISQRYAISYHGTFHLLIVNQIQQNIKPLFNSLIPYYPINTYWGYHLLLAILSNIFNTAAPIINYSLNIISLVLSLVLIKKHLKIKALALPILLSTNICYPIFKLLTPHFYLSADIRLINPLYHKYLNFSGFPLGILLFLVVLLGRPKYRPAVLIGLLIIHPTTAFIAILYLAVMEFKENSNDIVKLTKRAFIYLLFILSVLIYFIPILKNFHGQTIILTTSIIWFKKNKIIIVASILPILISKFLNKKKKTLSFEIIFFIFFILSLFIKLNENNQYKYLFLTIVMLSLKIYSQLKNDKFSKTFIIFLYLNIIIRIFFTINTYLNKKDWLNNNIYFKNKKLVLEDKKEVINLIENYPLNYLIIRKPVDMNNLFIEVASQHYPYTVSGGTTWIAGQEYIIQQRMAQISKILSLVCIDNNFYAIDNKNRFIILCN